eukprot:2480715-Rhodomonas_salina.1
MSRGVRVRRAHAWRTPAPARPQCPCPGRTDSVSEAAPSDAASPSRAQALTPPARTCLLYTSPSPRDRG